MATIYYPDGTSEERQPANGYNFVLAELQEIVGGYIEIVPCKDKQHILVINEEGKLEGLPINVKASELAALPTQAEIDELKRVMGATLIVVGDEDPLHGPDVIVGTVLYCLNSEVR